MKTIHAITFTLMILLIMNCKNEAKPEIKTVQTETSQTLDPNATYAKAEFTINGMTCAVGCAASIQKSIAKMDGVKSATVDFDRKLAMVEYDNAKINPTALEERVSKVADIYKVTNMKTVDSFSAE
ncbi:heavy-metal-associated domain-containing protein [Mariniflexile ostreae]|uniref:Heavy-metal-associated domain-containing protein n=1 Tax=Mariniflexile ostreae TaxID=1520892 RepID=A0ABV5F7N2_9FLAO